MLILSNNTKERDWVHIEKEVEPYLDILKVKIDLYPVSYTVPEENYFDHRWGIDRRWLRDIVNKYNNGHERVLFHCPDFKIRGAWGWFNRGISTPSQTIKQSYLPTRTRDSAKYNEFVYAVSRVIVHELCHAEAFRLGVEDETHAYQEKDDLKAYVRKLAKKKEQMTTILTLGRKVVSLLQRLIQRGDEVSFDKPVALHHTASHRNASIEDVRKWSKDWYNVIIRQGRIHRIHEKDRRGYEEVAVVCQTDPEYKKVTYQEPTENTLQVTREYLKGREVVTHRELGEQGKANPSTCPGVLRELL